MPPSTPPVAERVPVEACMAAMAAGDAAFAFTLVEHHVGPIAHTVRSILRELNRHDLAADPECVRSLVIDAAFVLFDRAGSWHPGGASPWRWAYRAIRAAIVAEIGPPIAELDLDRHDTPQVQPRAAPHADPLSTLTERSPAVAELVEALDRVTSPRNRDVFVEYHLQQAFGDPSPAHTVAPLFGLRPDNVRQIVRRTRIALARMSHDPAYPSLSQIAWAAA